MRAKLPSTLHLGVYCQGHPTLVSMSGMVHYLYGGVYVVLVVVQTFQTYVDPLAASLMVSMAVHQPISLPF